MTRLTSVPAGIRRGLIPAAAIATSATLAAAAFGSIPASAKAHGGYRQVNLVSDQTMKDVLKEQQQVGKDISAFDAATLDTFKAAKAKLDQDLAKLKAYIASARAKVP